MRLIAYNAKNKRGLFECDACGHMDDFKRKIVRRCANCGHSDKVRPVIMYQWRKRPAGYTRLIPPEDIDNAIKTMDRARAHGVRFECVRTFAGLRVVVVSVPNAPPKPFEY